MLLYSVSKLREELCWAAGLFDGEGYASLIPHSSQKSVCPVMALSMTHFGAVQRFHELFGVGALFEESPRQEHHKPALRWSARHRNALSVAEKLIDICVVKKAALQKIIDHYANYVQPTHFFKPGHISPTTKLNEDDVLAIRASKETGVVLAKKYGCSEFNISCIRRGKTWKHVGGLDAAV